MKVDLVKNKGMMIKQINKNIAVLWPTLIFIVFYIFLSSIIKPIGELYLTLSVLIWVFSLCIPEFLATHYFCKKNKRFMDKKEKTIISCFSAITKLAYLNAYEIISVIDSAKIEGFKASTIISLTAFWVGAIASLWLIEYLIYCAFEKILKYKSR